MTDIDVSHDVIGTTAQVIGFVNPIVLGPTDEQNSQSVQQFNISFVTDSNDIINADNVSIAIDGTLSADLTFNSGTAVIDVSMQDDGGTDLGGVDTSTTQQFTLTYTSGIFNDGFEEVVVKLMNYLASKQKQNSKEVPSYNAELDVIEFYNHKFQLNRQPINENFLQKVKDWIDEIELSESMKK